MLSLRKSGFCLNEARHKFSREDFDIVCFLLIGQTVLLYDF